jgi:hypothetical protein
MPQSPNDDLILMLRRVLNKLDDMERRLKNVEVEVHQTKTTVRKQT